MLTEQMPHTPQTCPEDVASKYGLSLPLAQEISSQENVWSLEAITAMLNLCPLNQIKIHRVTFTSQNGIPCATVIVRDSEAQENHTIVIKKRLPFRFEPTGKTEEAPPQGFLRTLGRVIVYSNQQGLKKGPLLPIRTKAPNNKPALASLSKI